MTLDFGSHVSASGGVHKALQLAVDVGATSCQIFSKNQRQWVARPLDPAVVEQFHAERERTGIEQMVIHDSYLINLASPKDDIHAKSMAAFADELERARTLNITNLVTHPGAHTGSGVDVGLAKFAESLNRLLDSLPNNPTITCLETTAGQGTTLGRTFEEIATIIDAIEDKSRVGVCFDTCHAFAAGYDLQSYDGTVKVFDEFDRVIGIDKLRVLHLNDSKQPYASNKDRHDHIGKGLIGTEAFRAIVNDDRLSGLPGILETEKDDAGENDRMNFATLRGLVEA